MRKHLLLTTIAAVVLAGCSKSQQSATSPKPPTAEWLADYSIHIAAVEGNIEAVKQHIAAGTDVNVKNDVGVTPLHWAVYYGHKEIVELLISNGAGVNAKNSTGLTPLDEAIRNEQPKIDDLLRKYGGKTGEELKAEGK